MIEFFGQILSWFSSLFDHSLIELIGEYGSYFYIITFVWTFLEGETFVIFAGYAAHQGLLDYWVLVAAAWSGSFAGDQLWFYLGRRYGQRILARFPKMQGGVETALFLARKYNTVFILSFRFIYGIRNVSSFALGMSGLSWPRYLVLNFIAAGIWANSFAGAGYLFGELSEAVLGDMAKRFGLAMLVVFLVVAWLAVRMHKRQKAKAEAEGAAK
ncbi:MAG: DedA family protein [Alphaproteobacteria bacterium]|nr:DedA family protein [Alphaproteobacteria bacterium]